MKVVEREQLARLHQTVDPEDVGVEDVGLGAGGEVVFRTSRSSCAIAPTSL